MTESLKSAAGAIVRDRGALSIDLTVTLAALVFLDPSGGYSGEVQALPGCFTEGETLEEVRSNLKDAPEGWLRAKRDLLATRPKAHSATNVDGGFS